MYPSTSCSGSVPMDLSEGPSPRRSSPPTDPTAYLTDTMARDRMGHNAEKALLNASLNKKPEHDRILSISFSGSAAMDVSEGPSPQGTSPSNDPAAYFKDLMAPDSEDYEAAEDFLDGLLDKKPEENRNPSDHVTPAAISDVIMGSPDESSSTSSSPVSQLQRSPFKETECYQELCRLGNGGNGNCFLLSRRPDNALRVCKVIKSKPELKNKRPAEADILQRILPPHERIVHMHELIVTSYTAELYFDYYSGGDLDRLMYRHFEYNTTFDEAFVWHCYQQLSEALAYIHTGYDAVSKRYQTQPLSSGAWTPIIHGDIKPMNIFVNPFQYGSLPSLVLGDFGNSRIQPGRALIGTVPWLPPEVPAYSVQSDVWGIGAIIHALCHQGRPPMRPFPSNWPPTAANIKTWHLSPMARKCEPMGFEYSSTLDSCLKMNMQWKPADRPSSRELLGWVDHEIASRRLYDEWYANSSDQQSKSYSTDSFFSQSSSDENMSDEESLLDPTQAFLDFDETMVDPQHQDTEEDPHTETQTSSSDQQLLFPANQPPFPQSANQPRYLGSLPDRNPYWLQDAQGNWFTGAEPVQPSTPTQDDEEMTPQPDDYVTQEPMHHPVSKPPSSVRHCFVRGVKVVYRLVKKLLRKICRAPAGCVPVCRVTGRRKRFRLD